ncbi:MAG: helix-turn-helix domain-containing protein [Oscillospiraceae bacterium]|nr:helix-turn-helix domain-containing protein [Oscillospiraceae bacterium]
MDEKKNFNKFVGERIRTLRLENGLTREQLAEKAEISDQFLYELETGKKGSSAKVLFSLATAFGVSADYLLTGKSETGETEYRKIIKILEKLPKNKVEWAERILADFVDSHI